MRALFGRFTTTVLVAEAKDWHGSRRYRLRTLEKVNTEALLVVAGQNLKRLLTYGLRGPKRPGQVAALRRPAPDPYEFCAVRRHPADALGVQQGFFNALTSLLGSSVNEGAVR